MDRRISGDRKHVYLRDRMLKWNDWLFSAIDLIWIGIAWPLIAVLALFRWVIGNRSNVRR